MAATSSPQPSEWVPGTEIDHVTAARTHLKSVFPEASINPSSVESVLLESLAVEVGPIAIAYQQAQFAVTEHLLGLHGLRRHQGRPATGKVTFYVTNQAPLVVIPAGTFLRYRVSDISNSLEFVTTSEVRIETSTSMEGTAYIEATSTGEAHNGIPAGVRLDTVQYLSHVEYVEVAQTTRAGQEPETDAAFTQRAMALLARQNSTLVYKENFVSAALTQEGVGRAFVVDNYNSDTDTIQNGHITVAVTDSTGQALPPDDVEDIRGWLQGQAIASISVHATDPTYTTVNLSATVEAKPGWNHEEVRAGVVEALTSRLDPMTWEWWSNITVPDVITWIDDAPGVARVIDVPAGASLLGVAPLPLPGVFTITVNESTR